jgi:hypothetical protein
VFALVLGALVRVVFKTHDFSTAAGVIVDDVLIFRVGTKDLERAHRVLLVLVNIVESQWAGCEITSEISRLSEWN